MSGQEVFHFVARALNQRPALFIEGINADGNFVPVLADALAINGELAAVGMQRLFIFSALVKEQIPLSRCKRIFVAAWFAGLRESQQREDFVKIVATEVGNTIGGN